MTQTAVWQGPITSYAAIGKLILIPDGTPLDQSNIIGPLRTDKVLVVVRGRFQKPDGNDADHWILVTSFSTDASGNIHEVFANDPWLGIQVRINPATKTLTAPVDYPLTGLTLNA